MINVPTRKAKNIEKALREKGFEISKKNKRRKHFVYTFIYNGKKTSIRTYISLSHPEYGNKLLSLIAKELKISNSNVLGLIDCPFSKEDLIKTYLREGIIKDK